MPKFDQNGTLEKKLPAELEKWNSLSEEAVKAKILIDLKSNSKSHQCLCFLGL